MPSVTRVKVATKSNTVAGSAPVPQAVFQTRSRVQGKTAARRDRNAIHARRLAAVSGVVIPSKVPVGQQPDQGRWESEERMIHPCPVCSRKFAKKYNIQFHMPACVKRNGNPNGARWDEAWRNRARRAAPVNAQAIGSQDLHMRDFQAEDDEVEDEQPAILLFGGSEGDNSTFRDFDTAVPMLEAPSPSASESDRQSGSSSSSDPTPYDPSLRTDVLTNEALLSMALSWQDFVQYAGESYTEVHPYFQRVMEEMGKRGMVDENWTWLVDFERVDMGWSRVVEDISRA